MARKNLGFTVKFQKKEKVIFCKRYGFNKPDFSQQFVGLYSLYDKVKNLPTHENRKTQTKIQTKIQDLQREELEAQFETQILSEVSKLKTFVI